MRKIIKKSIVLGAFVGCMLFTTLVSAKAVSAAPGEWTFNVDNNAKKDQINVKVETLSGYDADSTKITVKLNGTTKRTVVVDLGDSASAKNLEDKNGNIKIQDLILTHNHSDHINGLSYISKKTKGTVYIKNIFLNAMYFDNNGTMEKYLLALKKNNLVTIDNIYYIGAFGKPIGDSTNKAAKDFFNKNKSIATNIYYKNDIRTINVGGTGSQIAILPGIDYYAGGGSTNINNTSMMVVLHDNSKNTAEYKVVLPGDIQGKAMKELLSCYQSGQFIHSNYTDYLEPVGYTSHKNTKSVIYKAPHHGKGRWHDFLAEIPDNVNDAMYFNYLADALKEAMYFNFNVDVPDLYMCLRGFSLYAIDTDFNKYSGWIGNSDNDKGIYYSTMGLYEKELIKLVSPKTIIASQYTKEGSEDATKGTSVLQNAYLYKKYVELAVPSVKSVTIRGKFQKNSDVTKKVDLSHYFEY